jgi:uncharacterized protein (TIGR02217 family)
MLVPGSTTQYRLAKAYTSGGHTFLRPITKPVVGMVTLSTGSLDYATGNVSGGDGVTWAGQFDVPARFDSDAFTLTLEEIRVGQSSGVAIIEVRE